MPGWEDLPLWDTQKRAIHTVRRYFESGRRAKSSLVQMPTGTGKSGVIAVLAQCFEDTSCVLVVSPFAALRDQIARDVRERFWRKLSVQAPGKPVHRFRPSTVFRLLEKTEGPCVYVCTIQTLQEIFANPEHRTSFEALRERVSLVMFDEGHREPAPTWSEAVRSIGAPTVLLTATPYRNDHKFLQIDAEFVYSLSHHEALADRYIRDIRFCAERFDRTPGAFVDKLLAYYDGPFQVTIPAGATARVIIRCESQESVTAIHSLLRHRGRSAVAIHDEFQTDADQERYHAVPSPEQNDSVFWVHQNKLIEGIDDPSFRLLALYEPLRNARSLVQQVGRVLRNPERTEGQHAVVLCHLEDEQDEYWRNYIEYERNPGSFSVAELVAVAQQGYQYFEGNYRESFSFHDPNAYKHLAYRLSANVYSLRPTFSMQRFRDALMEEWHKVDRTDVCRHDVDAYTTVCIYCSYENSPLLLRHAFFEFELGYTVTRVLGSLLFYYDSQGVTSEYLRNHTRRISPTTLQHLFPRTSRISQVSLLNSDLGRQSIRRRTLNAPSIADAAPSLSDHAHVCSTAEGSVENADSRVRRYVGFSRARVSDKARHVSDFQEFCRWTDTLAEEIQRRDRGQTNRLFRRFSAFADPPPATRARNILLDLDEARTLFADLGGNYLEVDDLCLDISSEGQFILAANGDPYTVRVGYDPDQSEYAISSEGLAQSFVSVSLGTAKPETLVSYLNKQQSFRVVPQTPGYLYSHGHFYTTRLQQGDLDLGRLLISVPELVGKSEKGGNGTAGAGGWSDESVFGLLDRLGATSQQLAEPMTNIDHLVCDDLSTEIADFIAVDTHYNRVIFIHAKAGDGPNLSASDLAEVCGQAVKNLDYLQPYPSDKPTRNISRWNRPWTHADIGTVPRRIRLGDRSGLQFWELVQEVLRNPNSTREVWIVIGNGFSSVRFEEEKRKVDPAPQFVQAYYQLAATWSAVSSVGAKLRVFCCP